MITPMSEPAANPPLGAGNGRAGAGKSRPRQALRWLKRLGLLASRRLGAFSSPERRFVALIPVVGLATGVAAIVLMRGVILIEEAIWGRGSHILDVAFASSHTLRFLAPTVGGLIVALIVVWGRMPPQGKGTGGLIEAVALKGGRFDVRESALAQLCGMVTVGSGGSLGREGPIIQAGATIASYLGVRQKLSGNTLRILVGCGAAAGMSAAYNAPLGGAIFAMEVILGNFALDIFGPIVIASVAATFLSRLYVSAASVYVIPTYALGSGWELPLHAILGGGAGVLAAIVIVGVGWGERAFARIPLPWVLKTVCGFALVGWIGVHWPYIYGNGYDTVNLALHEQLPLTLLLTLPLIKLVATSITSGSGGRGGFFTPSLFVGALVGGAFGHLVQAVFPGLQVQSGAYALVGMGAIAAGTTHAPLSAIMVIFEMTGNYAIILPLMVSCILANFVSRRLKPESLHLDTLVRRGVKLPRALEELVMEQTTARDIMREDRDTVRDTTPFPDIFGRFLETRRNHVYVIDAAGRFCGAVSLHDVKRVLDQSQSLGFVLAVDVMREDFPCVPLDERLTRVLERFAEFEHERLPVVRSAQDRTFMGLVSKRDVIALYNQEVLHRPALLAKFTTEDEAEPTFVELPSPYRVDQVDVPATMVGQKLSALELQTRYDATILVIKRRSDGLGEKRIFPRGDTLLEAGDRIVLIAPAEQLERLKQVR